MSKEREQDRLFWQTSKGRKLCGKP